MDTWQILHANGRIPPAGECGSASLLEIAKLEAECHRWIESQQRGRDVGPAACCDWVRQHWRKFCRWRYLEHLLGVRCYCEFDVRRYCSLRGHQDWCRDAVMEFVLQHLLQEDRECVELLFTAPEHVNRDRIVSILTLVDFNSARLGHPTWEQA